MTEVLFGQVIASFYFNKVTNGLESDIRNPQGNNKICQQKIIQFFR